MFLDGELTGHIIRVVIMVVAVIWVIWPMIKAAAEGDWP